MRISDWSSDVCSSDLPAWSGSSTPPMPAPPEIWQFLPICAQELMLTQVSIMVPLSTRAPTLTKLGDRKSVVSGKSVSVRVDCGGRRLIKKKIDKFILIVKLQCTDHTDNHHRLK